jgi:multidrug efflux pump subunit AcrA (membrane-fusion protein)
MLAGGICLAAGASQTGCSPAGAESAKKDVTPPIRSVPVTVAPLQRRTVERTVEVVGSLRGWEQVTVGSKRSGRVIRVLHDIGDQVQPDEPLLELDPVDARLAYDLAQSRFLAELVKLGISAERAEEFVKQYGISEELVRGQHADQAIDGVPAVVQVQLAREKAQRNLNRQRALGKKGASTVQELEDYESEFRTATATLENARATARNVIATAVASWVSRDQARQALVDMTIRVPRPGKRPPASSEADPTVYSVTKRQVSEGQMIKEGEAAFDLVIENPLRLWTNVPERYTENIRVGQLVRIAVASHPETRFEGKIVRINPAVDSVSRTFQVETQVPNDRRLLRPGGFAKATIVTDSASEAAVVPIESIAQFAGVTKLFLIEDGRARAVNDIVTGIEGQGWIEVSSKSLPASGSVATTGQSQLADGTPVVIRTPETAPSEPANTAEAKGRP